MIQKNTIIVVIIIIVLVAGLFLAYSFWQKAEAPEPNGENNATSTLPNATSTLPDATTTQPTFYPWLPALQAQKIKYSHIDKITSIPLQFVIESSTIMQNDANKKVASIGYGDFDNDGQEEAAFNISGGSATGTGPTLIYKLVKVSDVDNFLTDLPIDRGFIQNLKQGYQGHFGFNIVDNRLIESFPLYQAGDANCCPSGGVRYILYKWDGQNKKFAVNQAIILEKQWFDRVKSSEITFGDVLNEALNRFGL